METVTVESIPIALGREEDGRWLAKSGPGLLAQIAKKTGLRPDDL
ncbi:MAG TPA: hypothetical protein VN924_33475 [Bryobacteraceae bacterium]|nr:hypothetical protein [Bryobacteraceae bacterium]